MAGLVGRALTGEPAALDRLAAVLTPVIQARVARTLLARRFRLAGGRVVRQEVEDLCQDVFLALLARDGRVLRAWKPERGLSLENFVGLVAKCEVLSFLRSSRRNPWQEDTSLSEGELDAETEDPGPEEIATSREQLALLLDRLYEELSPLGWRMFELPLRPGSVAGGCRGGERPLRRCGLCLAQPPALPGPGAPGRDVRKRGTGAKDLKGWPWMNEDRLLRELGDLARQEDEAERARFDERWDRLAAGTLTAEEEAELKALAGSSPEAREAYEAFRPLGADFQARMVAAAQAEIQEPRPRVLPFRRAAARIEVWLGTAAAVAAGLFFFLRMPAPSLPGYVAELTGGVKTSRGGEAGPSDETQVFVPESLLTLDVQPDHPAGSRVEPRAFLSSRAGEENLRPWAPQPHFQIADKGGAVRLQGRLGQDLQLSPGDWILWIVVAPAGKAPSAREVQDKLRADRPLHDSWQAVCSAVHAEPSRPPAPWQAACAALRVETQPSP